MTKVPNLVVKKISRKTLFLIVLLSVLAISASSFLMSRDEDTLPLDVQIDRFIDGTSIITDRQNGYKFTVPTGWYPLSIPATSDEINEFNNIVRQNNLPLNTDWALNLPADGMQLAIVDLDARHHENDSGVLIAVLYTDMARFTPSGLVTPFIELLKSTGKVTNAYIVEKSEQEVGVVELASSLEQDNPFSGENLVVFIRNERLFVIVGATTRQEILPSITLAIDEIIYSLEFFDIN